VTIQQLNMDLDDEPGRLFSVTDALGEAGVNIRALSVVDREGVSTVRMLVSDVKKARAVVLALDVPARVDEVLVIEISDTPGSLAAMLEPVFDEYVNIRYLEAFSEINGHAVAIVKFSDNAAAEEVLRKCGHISLSLDAVFPESEVNE
jgi:hypothetical protein